MLFATCLQVRATNVRRKGAPSWARDKKGDVILFIRILKLKYEFKKNTISLHIENSISPEVIPRQRRTNRPSCIACSRVKSVNLLPNANAAKNKRLLSKVQCLNEPRVKLVSSSRYGRSCGGLLIG